ncbi:hypothetical protein D3C78_1370370 [compost metagenome]
MRSGTALMARGMVRPGSLASPAVMPMISMPPKANTTTASDAISPPTPLGMKPPCSHRLCTPVAALSTFKPKPNSMMPSPPAIIAIIAPTFSNDSQNSSSPNTLTEHRLMAPMKNTMDSTQIQRGTSGYQKPM